ncbi:MAG TPA: TetR/AcrR family transcriptional regulator [Acidimicrobiales bacterium]|nr:TetR/AcrR family transcriptional regulator [Acidimicrobiales bacterium]
MSTPVKGNLKGTSSRSRRSGGETDRRVAHGDATRANLVAVARRLFGEQGYAETSADEIAAAAGVTKGALYHHFDGKEDLFRAVFEQVELEISDKAASEFLNLPDAWEALTRGCALWVEAYLDPAVQRIVLSDARAVLGAAEVRAVENRFGAVALRGALRKAIYAGIIERQPLRPLSQMLAGALGEACLYIADAEDPELARAEVTELIETMMSGFRVAAPA